MKPEIIRIGAFFSIVLVVLGGLVAALILLVRERKGSAKSRPCPVCGSWNTTPAPKGVAKGMHIPPIRSCNSCGTLWRQPCSIGTSVMTLIAAVMALGLGVELVYAAISLCLDELRKGDRVIVAIFVALLGFGLAWIFIALRVLWHAVPLVRGRGCALEILRKSGDAVQDLTVGPQTIEAKGNTPC